MDEATKKYNDEHYDWWSTEGPARVVQVYSSERGIAMADWWHEYFFWQPQAKKQWNWNSKDLRKAIRFPDGYCYNVFYKPLITPKNEWGGDVSRLGDGCQTEYPLSANISILYKRDVYSIHLKELAELQMECEELIGEAGFLYNCCDSYREKLSKILPFGKKEAREELENKERRIKELNGLIDQRMQRVAEVREMILKEQE